MGKFVADTGGISNAHIGLSIAESLSESTVLDSLKRELVTLLGDQDNLSIFVLGPAGSGRHFLVNQAVDNADVRESVQSVTGTKFSFRLPYGAIQFLLSGLPEHVEMTHATVFTELFRVFSRNDQKMWLLVDNAAFIDRATLAVLSQLVMAGKFRMMIFGEHLAALPQELSILSSLPSSATIELAQASREELRDIVHEITGFMASSYLTAVLHETSQGRLGEVRTLLQQNMELGRIRVSQGTLVVVPEGLTSERTTQHAMKNHAGPLFSKQRELLDDLYSTNSMEISMFSQEAKRNLDQLIDSGVVVLDPDLPKIHGEATGTERHHSSLVAPEIINGNPVRAALSANRDSRIGFPEMAAEWIEETTALLASGLHVQALRHFRDGPSGEQYRSWNRTGSRFEYEHAALASAVLACNGQTLEADQYLDWLVETWWTEKNSYGASTTPNLVDLFHSNVLTAAILLGRWSLARRIIDGELNNLDPANYSLAKGFEAVLNVLAGNASPRTLDELRSNSLGTRFPVHAEFMQSVFALGQIFGGSNATAASNIVKKSETTFTDGYSALGWWSIFMQVLANSSETQSQDEFLYLASEAAEAGDSVARLYAVACAVRNGHFESVPLLERLAQGSKSASAHGFHQVAIGLKTGSQWDLVTGLRAVAGSGFGLYTSDWCNQFYSILSGQPRRAALRISPASMGSYSIKDGKHGQNGILQQLLTKSEFRVATAVAQGMSNREIAQREGVSVRTVEGHLYQTYSKLNIANRRQLNRIVHATVLENGDEHD